MPYKFSETAKYLSNRVKCLNEEKYRLECGYDTYPPWVKKRLDEIFREICNIAECEVELKNASQNS